jgi:acetyltransferase-like isoleucine patch superfamily enzyme
MRNLMRTTKRLFHRANNVYLKIRLSYVDGLAISDDVVFDGTPIIEITEGATVSIGNCTTINSSNVGHHINMHSPVKLLADRHGASITIGNKTRIHGTCIHAYKSVTIGDNCLIAANCQIIDSNGHELSFDNVENRINTSSDGKPIVIEDCVWLGANTIVLPGVRIGRGSIVAAGSVVVNDVPPMVIAAGNPARTVRTAEQILNAGQSADWSESAG